MCDKMDGKLKEHLYVHKYDEWSSLFNKQIYKRRELNIQEVAKGIVLPTKRIPGKSYDMGGVCTRDFEFVAGLLRICNLENPGGGGVARAYRVKENELDYVGKTVLYGGHLINHIGHMLLECIAARLWWVEKILIQKLK